MHVPAPTRAARVIGDEDDDDVTRAPTMVMAVFPKFNRLRREGALGRQVGYAVRALAVVAAAGPDQGRGTAIYGHANPSVSWRGGGW